MKNAIQELVGCIGPGSHSRLYVWILRGHGTEPEGMFFVKVTATSKSYRARDGHEINAIQDISFSVLPNEFVTIIGPSGCGKTTLLKLVAGILAPTLGSVVVDNKRPGEHPAGTIGMVFQNPVLLEWRTVLANILLPVEFCRLPTISFEQLALDRLKLVGLDQFATKFPRELSGGMQQRVAITRALILNPQLLLMDEPFGALDALTRQAMRLELLRIWDTIKQTVIFVTHSIEEAVLLSDRVIVLTKRPGRIKGIVAIKLPRPRSAALVYTPQFAEYSSNLYQLISSP